MRHLNDVHVVATHKTRILIGEDVTDRHARELLRCWISVSPAVRCSAPPQSPAYRGLNQRQRPVFQLACSIGFRVNVEDLFSASARAFERNRILIATPGNGA